MQTVILKHRVSDYDQWITRYDTDAPRVFKAGLREIKIGPKSDDTNLVYMIWETIDATKIQELVKDPLLLEWMRNAGVISEPELVIIN
jgi:hypothetical protein